MSWAAAFTNEMLELKRCGEPFDRAWDYAIAKWPPKLRQAGLSTRDMPADLFELDTVNQALRWFRLVCEEAWTGAPAVTGGPSRLHLLPGLVSALNDVDQSEPAHRRRLAA